MLCFPCSIKQLKGVFFPKIIIKTKNQNLFSFCGNKCLITLGVSVIAEFNDKRTERKTVVTSDIIMAFFFTKYFKRYRYGTSWR
jgi:hypothetical protein